MVNEENRKEKIRNKLRQFAYNKIDSNSMHCKNGKLDTLKGRPKLFVMGDQEQSFPVENTVNKTFTHSPLKLKHDRVKYGGFESKLKLKK